MNVDLSSGRDDMKQRYEFVCGGCGHKTNVVMEPGAPVTLHCSACQFVIYSKGPRVCVNDVSIPGANTATATLVEDDNVVRGDDKIITVDGFQHQKRKAKAKPKVVTPPADERIDLEPERDERARKLLESIDWDA